jgi:putative DNA methylase
MSDKITPFSLKDAPALIERLLPVQKLCAEAYKEQMANVGKTLTALGSYWKGRKPLILVKASVLGCLLPATDDRRRDLEIFEKLMAMDDESFVSRWKRRSKPEEILATLSIARIADYFNVEPVGILPESAPVDWLQYTHAKVKVTWREDITELERRRLEAQTLPALTYRERVKQAKRPEEVMDSVHDHIWEPVNRHLGTNARSFQELVEQLGIMRFGHRPLLADTFCGSGQIAFEAARLGCEVYASDLNPIACMLTWGAFNIVGGSMESRKKLEADQRDMVERVQAEIDRLGVETDGNGWTAKAFLYCVEVRCPTTGWMVPLMPSRHINQDQRAIALLIPDPQQKRYEIAIVHDVSDAEFDGAHIGTVRTDGRGTDPFLVHSVNGVEYKTKISTLRGDYRNSDGSISNRLRRWEMDDITPRRDDLFQERLYAVQWTRPKTKGKGTEVEFRSVGDDDLRREHVVQEYVVERFSEWQQNGWVPNMHIEPGYNTDQPIRERGWTYWHHLFNPRQLMIGALCNANSQSALSKLGFAQALNWDSKLCRWAYQPGGRALVLDTFANQALNTLYNYGTRAFPSLHKILVADYKRFPLSTKGHIINCAAHQSQQPVDIFITDPPYGDAVNFDEILEFFIAWMRKNPPPEFANWIWDSRRSLAIKGEGEGFRRGMVAAYKRMTECMPDNGIQVIMFTHQSGALWADMANIVWASGLQVTAAWYVVTETDNALREGSYVKGTVLLVCRKREGAYRTTRDDLAWEIQEEVQAQVESLTGLNQQAKGLYRDENVFEDADLQMAGYAAALRSLTRYAFIDGRDMTAEAIRPRERGKTTFVDDLITFAVDTANQCLVPQGIEQAHWDKLSGAERFYLKMLDLESRGAKSLDNYQNFAKAFKVRDFRPYLFSQKANDARLKGAVELGVDEMSEGSELHQSTLRAILYAMMELDDEVDGSDVLAHLILNIPNYYGDPAKREMAINVADYIERKLDRLRPDEASSARVLGELVKNQRLG